MKRISVIGLAVVLGMVGPVFGGGDEEPYRIVRPVDRVVCLNPGTACPEITTCVVESDEGLVVIDTGLSPEMAGRTRARIGTELGRDDVRWVINTHSHFDHTSGNQAYSGVPIIGHENARAEMQAFFDRREGWIERRRKRLDAKTDALSEGTPGAVAHVEDRRFEEELLVSLKGGFRLTPPTVTFSDRLEIEVGDLRLRMVWVGGCHTQSDLFVLVPDLGVAFSGDVFEWERLGLGAYSNPLAVTRWLAAMDEILADSRITTIVGGHGLVFSRAWVVAQRRYLGEVWRAVGEAKAAGQDLAAFESDSSLDEFYEDVADVIGGSPEGRATRHREVVQQLWRAAD